jgi:hypothetical protein
MIKHEIKVELSDSNTIQELKKRILKKVITENIR